MNAHREICIHGMNFQWLLELFSKIILIEIYKNVFFKRAPPSLMDGDSFYKTIIWEVTITTPNTKWLGKLTMTSWKTLQLCRPPMTHGFVGFRRCVHPSCFSNVALHQTHTLTKLEIIFKILTLMHILIYNSINDFL